MTAGTTLASLKNDYRAAEQTVTSTVHRTLIIALSIFFVGLVTPLLIVPISYSSITGSTLYTLGTSILSAACLISLVVLFSQYFMKKPRSQKAARDAALATYTEALNTEIASYGIDTASIVNHTESTGKNYEFTALRNNEPIDVTVRDFHNEIVFMLDGKRMEKPVSV